MEMVLWRRRLGLRPDASLYSNSHSAECHCVFGVMQGRLILKEMPLHSRPVGGVLFVFNTALPLIFMTISPHYKVSPDAAVVVSHPPPGPLATSWEVLVLECLLLLEELEKKNGARLRCEDSGGAAAS